MATANALGYVDHSEFGTLGVNLAFGRRVDGTIAHISEVERGLACDCVCPACEVPIVAHKPDKPLDGRRRMRQHHFKHHRNSEGCTYGPETNAHYFAKLLLERVKWITLPERWATVDGVTRLMQPAMRFDFDEVLVEQRLDRIIPDLIVTKDGNRLLVEAFVTHRCDDAKVTYIRSLGISAIEVDLSRYRTEEDDAVIEEGFLTKAPRAWLHNRRAEEDAKKIRDDIAAQQRAAALALEQVALDIVEAVRKTKVAARLENDVAVVNALSRGQLLGIGDDTDGFDVPTAEWQAMLLVETVIRPSREREASFPVTVDVVLAHIRDCIVPELREPLPDDVDDKLAQLAPELVLPPEAIAAYLKHLEQAGVLEPAMSRGRKVYQVASHEKTDLRQRIKDYLASDKNQADFLYRLQAILNRLGPDDLTGFGLATWKADVPGFGQSLSDICGNGEAWARINTSMRSLEAMVGGGAPAPPNHHLGLPVGRLVAEAAKAEQRRREEVAQREAARLQQQRDTRVAHMRRAAQDALGPDAAAWLAQPDAQGLTPLENAAEDFAIVERLYDQLHTMKEDRHAQAKADQFAVECQARLRKAAVTAYGHRADHAELFLQASHPKLDGKSPLAYCRDDATLNTCMTLLPGRRR